MHIALKHHPAAKDGKSSAALSVVKALSLTCGGLAALVIGARLFVVGAVTLARLVHISEAVIALTIVALGTSLPELATSAVAAWKGETEIAVGNVVGSNLFNILFIMSVAPLARPLATPGIAAADIAVMCALVVLLWAMMLFRNKLGKVEGALLLAVYTGYVTSLVLR